MKSSSWNVILLMLQHYPVTNGCSWRVILDLAIPGEFGCRCRINPGTCAAPVHLRTAAELIYTALTIHPYITINYSWEHWTRYRIKGVRLNLFKIIQREKYYLWRVRICLIKNSSKLIVATSNTTIDWRYTICTFEFHVKKMIISA